MKYNTEQQPTETAQGPFAEKENILLVDDLPANLLVYQTILEELGQNLVVARSGEEALKTVLKQDFAVILLDVNMPTMNGFETATLIRKRKKSARTPIIFLTAFTDEMNMIQGYASGAVDFLPTPIIPEILKAKVRVFIEMSRMRRQAALQAEERVRREAAEEAARKSALLAKVSETLVTAQSQVEVLQALTRLAVPQVADFSWVWLRREHEADDPWMVVQGGVLEESFSPIPWVAQALDQVMVTGQPTIFNVPPELQEQIHQNIPPGTLLLLPLNLPKHVHAILLLGRHHKAAPYQPDDIPLAMEFAYRTSAASKNVSLLEKIREADRRKDEFLGMLAHELRNPLGPIYNCLQLQKMLPATDPRIKDLRDIIDRQAKHMSRLIDDLLDATRLAHGKILLRKERCDLAKIVHQTIEDYRTVIEGNGLHIENINLPGPIWVTGDPTRLVQSVGNLLHNANKFTRSGGTITVALEVDPRAQIATVKVSDTGIGIDAAMIGHIFDVFRQAEQGLDRSRGGLGLGLALVKGLIELHGGKVIARSDGQDKGAEFTIFLPLENAQAQGGDAPCALRMRTGEKYRILLIEDNHDAAQSAELLLGHEGHDVKTATTAFEGLRIAHSFRPKIIICDIGLPEVNGYQVARAIRKNRALSSIFLIALTGYGREEDQRQALMAGFDVHLTKPIDYQSLCHALDAAARKSEREVAE